jgi:hypothetical protein
VGLCFDQKLFGVAAFHGDVRAIVIFDEMSDWNLPLQRVAWGFSAGPEVKLTRRTSLQAQFDGASTPYLPTGTAALDSGYGDLTIGVSHRFAAGAREVVAHLYARENMNLPFSVRLNADPDLAIGLKATIRARAR